MRRTLTFGMLTFGLLACQMPAPGLRPEWGSQPESAGSRSVAHDAPSAMRSPSDRGDAPQQAAAKPAERRQCGTHHEEGATVAYARAHYGVPILGKSLAWNGEGEVDDFGLGFYVHHYVWDDVALGAGFNTSVYSVSGSDIYTGEFELSSRWYIAAVDDVGIYFDANAGYQQATTGVPPGGTEWNFTFGFGPGLDIPLSAHSSLLISFNYHHMSNALGRQNPQNPSQNEGRGWIGYAWDW